MHQLSLQVSVWPIQSEIHHTNSCLVLVSSTGAKYIPSHRVGPMPCKIHSTSAVYSKQQRVVNGAYARWICFMQCEESLLHQF